MFWSFCPVSSGASSARQSWTCWIRCRGGSQKYLRDGTNLLWTQAERAGVVQPTLFRRVCSGRDLIAALQYLKSLIRKDRDFVPPSSSFILAFIVEQSSCDMEYHFGWFGSAVLPVSPPKTLPTPSLLVRGEYGRHSLDAVKHSPAVVKALALVINTFPATKAQHSKGF